MLNKIVVSLIHDITPAMNRELHGSDSYLSNEEFKTLQHVALSVIAVLEEKLDENNPICLTMAFKPTPKGAGYVRH